MTGRVADEACAESGAPEFFYRDGQLHCEQVAIAGLVERFGSPLYVYSQAAMRQRVQSVRAANRRQVSSLR